MLAGNAFGDAGHRIVIEEFLDGEEASFIVMVDGEHVLPMATSRGSQARRQRRYRPEHRRDGGVLPGTGGY